MSVTFKKGIHPFHKKTKTENLEIESVNLPKTVYISLSQHIGKPAKLIVEAGQKVKCGELIGLAEAGISANIYSSVSGTVTGIVKRSNAQGSKVDHVQIENDFLEEKVFLPILENPSKEEIIARVKEAGIVGMGGAAFPTHIKLSPPPNTVLDTLIINTAECEPYITCDYRILLELTDDFIEGVKLLKKATGTQFVIIGIEDNKINAVNHLKNRDDVYLANNFKKIKKDKINIIVLKSKYPQGAEKQLIYAISKRIIPEGALPSAVGICVNNVHTALSVYYAVKKGKPLYERVLTVSGDACKKPCNMWVKSGTSYRDLSEKCVQNNKYEMLVSGGPMMGLTVYTEDISVTNATSSILFLTDKEIDFINPSPCIGCGKCVMVCPMNLMPVFIDSNVLTGDYKEAKRYGAMSCIECGCCSYICPAKKPLVQSIKLAKKMIRERKI